VSGVADAWVRGGAGSHRWFAAALAAKECVAFRSLVVLDLAALRCPILVILALAISLACE
jgi:hypothetical protein